MKIIVGLGNPGKKYAKTRHNVGFRVLDWLHDNIAKATGISAWQLNKKFNAEVADYKVGGEAVLLVKPLTFMNASGQTVQLILEYYKLSPHDLLVVHDDKDLPLGEIRAQADRGHAGHNGVRSIIECLGTKEFARLRLGIANTDSTSAPIDTADFVLHNFGLRERGAVHTMVEAAADAVVEWITPDHNS